MKQTREDLKKMQSWDLNTKIRVSQTRILEWCIKYDFNICISFSAGKDSCVLADLVAYVWSVNKENHGNQSLKLVYSDTGMEFIDVKKHAEIFRDYLAKKHNINVELIMVKPEMNTHRVFKEIGYPIISKKTARQLRELQNPKESNFNTRRLYASGEKQDGSRTKSFELSKKWKRIFNVDEENYTAEIPFKVSEECCHYFKKTPLTKYQKESGTHPFVGTMASDSDTREHAWYSTGCNDFKKGGQSKPISFWLEQDVLTYIKTYNIPISSVYGNIVEIDGKLKTTGEHNTGCKYCMFGCHLEKGENRFERLKKIEPNSYDYAMREENGLGMAKVLDYIKVKY